MLERMESSATLFDKRMPHLVGIGLVLGYILPHSSTLFLLVNPVLCLFYQLFKQNTGGYKYNVVVFVGLLLSLVVNINQEIEQKSLLSFITICLYFMCFPIVKNVKVYNIYIYIILAYIIVSQLAYVLGISSISNYLDTYYPYSDRFENEYISMKSHIGWNNLFDFRLGGIYRNPNQCAYYVSSLLVFYLISNKDKNIDKVLLFVLLCFISALLTGSRTGFLIVSFIIIIDVFFIRKTSKVLKNISVLVLFVMGLYVFIIQEASALSYRALDISGGREGSLQAKLDVLFYYLSNEKSVVKLLFGYLDPTRFVPESIDVMSKFDADIGYLIYQFGFVGSIIIIIYFVSLFKRCNGTGRLFFILLFWSVSSSVITSYRAFFVFMLLLSCVYSNNGK